MPCHINNSVFLVVLKLNTKEYSYSMLYALHYYEIIHAKTLPKPTSLLYIIIALQHHLGIAL